MSVEFLVVTAKEPGVKTPERGRRRLRAEKKTIVGLKKEPEERFCTVGPGVQSDTWRRFLFRVVLSNKVRIQ